MVRGSYSSSTVFQNQSIQFQFSTAFALQSAKCDSSKESLSHWFQSQVEEKIRRDIYRIEEMYN